MRTSDGKPEGFIGIERDLTERHRLQQQQQQQQQELLASQRMQSIGALAAGIVHDFNNLLVVIMGTASVLARDPSLPGKARDLLKDIVQAAERGSSLTGQLLAYARGGSQKPSLTDLNRLVRPMAEMLRRTAPPLIDLNLHVAADLPPILADATQIEQVTMNLCLNAIQASRPPSAIDVVTSQEILDDQRAAELELVPGRYVRLVVRDRGCGMDAETIQRIFEPFFSTKTTGSGMGLPVTQGIVHRHKGQIRVASAPGEGTTVSVWLPASAGGEPTAAIPETPDEKTKLAGDPNGLPHTHPLA